MAYHLVFMVCHKSYKQMKLALFEVTLYKSEKGNNYVEKYLALNKFGVYT